ncbi:inosine triphosphate pyrophosphatase-like protein [Baffinella frigidus]|nr:inosine triphosphate pyrophosphatase-like protein [Cryptophyta sp. CCMP2293]
MVLQAHRWVCVASKNPVKCNAARLAIEQSFPSAIVEVVGESVPSGVADQPMTDRETRTGAENRARAAKERHPGFDLYVGMEGGLEEDSNKKLRCFAWMVIISTERPEIEGSARSACFELPEAVSKLVRGGMELGEADDQVFARENSGKGDGTIGRLTHGMMSRTEYYRHAMLCALVPFLNPSLY